MQVAREIQIHSTLHHEHIIALYGAFEDSKHVYLVQEFAVGATLLVAPEMNWVVLGLLIADCRRAPQNCLPPYKRQHLAIRASLHSMTPICFCAGLPDNCLVQASSLLLALHKTTSEPAQAATCTSSLGGRQPGMPRHDSLHGDTLWRRLSLRHAARQ